MNDVLIQVKAEVPETLKRRTFAALALRGERFGPWLKERMQHWLDAHEAELQKLLPHQGNSATEGRNIN